VGVVLTMCFVGCSAAEPLGTAFTYQGRLIDANSVADGLYDFEFKVYDANVAGTQKGSTIDVNEMDVIDGYFTVLLDSGSDIFNGDARWLQIGVRPGEQKDPNVYTVLLPRQEITPTPYALQTRGLFVDNAGNVGIGTSSPASKLHVVGDIDAASVYKIAGSTVLSVPGTTNTFVGVGTGANNTTDGDNTFSGFMAGNSNTTGSYNTFSGSRAGWLNTTGYYNTFLGSYAGYSNTEGSANTFSGSWSGYSNTIGFDNTFSGYMAGCWNTTGNFNTFLGMQAGSNNTTGDDNTFSGFQAGLCNTEGVYNTFSGSWAGRLNTTGCDNTFSGFMAGSNTTGSYNTFSGSRAGWLNTTGNYNTFLGSYAGYSNTAGVHNTFSGFGAGHWNTEGSANTFSGYLAGYSNTIGQRNTFSGYATGYSNTTGNDNTFLGHWAGNSNTTGSYNTFLGQYAGYSNTTGTGNVFIGYQAGYNETGSNKLYIANSDVNPPLIYGDFSTGRVGLGTMTLNYRLQLPNTADVGGKGQANAWVTYSSRRWKTNIQPIGEAVEKVKKLRGVYFDWKSNGKHDIGLVAEEVAQVIPEVVGYEEDGKYASSLDYGRLVALLVEAAKEQQDTIAALRAEKDAQIESLAKANEDIKVRLTAMESLVAKLSLQHEGGIK